jgi:NHS family xanthosine MFS transporter
MMMSNGFGAFFGGIISGFIIDKYFTINGKRDWHNIWLAFAIYALVVAILFAVFFKHKHNPKDVENVGH